MTVIPERLKDEFIGYMQAFDMDDLPDGAWFAVLEEEAWKFMKRRNIKGDSNTATFQYLIWRSEV